jgi:hypothetical protein
MVEKQFDKSILCLHDDKGGEFIGIKWDAFFAQHGIDASTRSRRRRSKTVLPSASTALGGATHRHAERRAPARALLGQGPELLAPRHRAQPVELDPRGHNALRDGAQA